MSFKYSACLPSGKTGKEKIMTKEEKLDKAIDEAAKVLDPKGEINNTPLEVIPAGELKVRHTDAMGVWKGSKFYCASCAAEWSNKDYDDLVAPDEIKGESLLCDQCKKRIN